MDILNPFVRWDIAYRTPARPLDGIWFLVLIIIYLFHMPKSWVRCWQGLFRVHSKLYNSTVDRIQTRERDNSGPLACRGPTCLHLAYLQQECHWGGQGGQWQWAHMAASIWPNDNLVSACCLLSILGLSCARHCTHIIVASQWLWKITVLYCHFINETYGARANLILGHFLE